MDAIITEFLNSDLCESLGNDPRCPDVIDAVLRNGLPLLAADAKPDDFTQVSLIKSNPYMLHLKYPKSFYKIIPRLATWPSQALVQQGR